MAEKNKKNKKKSKVLFLSYPSKEKDYFVDNLSMLISSGMGVLPALNITREDIKSKVLKRIITEIIVQVENGTSLWRAIDSSKLFSGYFISLLKIGEESGRLADNLKIIAAQSEKDKIFKSKIRSAVMYPMFVLVLMVVVALAIAWFILPKLASVFTNLRMDLPFITEILINTGVFLAEEGVWVIPLVAFVMFLVIFFLFLFPKTKHIGRGLFFHVPGFKDIIQQVEVARFGFILGTLLKAGLPVTVAFDSLIQATSFPAYKKFFIFLRDDINEGISFQDAFESYKNSHKLIPRSIQQMINSGQQSGRLADILVKVSNNMEAKTEVTAKNLSVILEPVLLVIVWLGVVAVALAVILPIYSLVGGLNDERNQASSSPPPPPMVKDVEIVVPVINNIEEPIVNSTIIEEPLPQLEIAKTGIGYLNVRKEGGLSGEIVGQVIPGEVYDFLSLIDNWYEIILNDGSTGWVLGEYVIEFDYDE